MKIDKEQKKVLWAFVISIILFTIIFVLQGNFEFIGYVVVVLLLFWALWSSSKHVFYPNFVLWGLFLWAFLHMLGGVAMSNGKVVYTKMLIPIIGAPYSVLKYDQVVHALGFFVATLVMYYVLKKYLKEDFGWVAVGIVVAMAGLGLGALNEIVEFIMTVVLPNTNVGGYENTAIDLISNFVGAVLAVFYLKNKVKK